MEKNSIQSGNEIISFNPANGEEVGRVPKLGAAQVRQAVEIARGAQKRWARTSFDERAEIMFRARKILLDEMETVAEFITLETGKPKFEAFSMEIVPTADLLRYFAVETKQILRDEVVDLGLFNLQGRASKIIYEPLGVVGIISPWNFPWAIPFGETAMALMAGNAVVLKPSELTPFVALKIADIFQKAHLPENLLQVITGDGETGAHLVKSGVNKIMFTGSVATGKKIAAAAAENLTPVVLELGGKDPLIVLEDANLDTAARAAVWGAFANSGQACASVERCYVQEKVAPEFTQRVIELTRRLHQDEGFNPRAEIGAMASIKQLEIVENHIESFRREGAKILLGGKRSANSKGAFFPPTVIAGVTHEMTAMREETFGPTLPIMTFKTDEEAIRLANDSEFGLTASVFTKNLRRGEQIAEQIEAGTVMINEVLYTHGIASTPWGGVKNSGYGRTHGRQGLLELVQPKHIHINKISAIADLWWFGYSEKALNLFRSMAKEFTSGSIVRTATLMPKLLRRLDEQRKLK